MDPALQVNGDWPDLVNGVLEELLVSEMLYQGRVLEPANVIHLRVDANWRRLYFDSSIVFWREDDRAPKDFTMPELASGSRVVDLGRKYGLTGAVVESVVGRLVAGGSEVRFTFSNGKSIVFANLADRTSYRF